MKVTACMAALAAPGFGALLAPRAVWTVGRAGETRDERTKRRQLEALRAHRRNVRRFKPGTRKAKR